MLDCADDRERAEHGVHRGRNDRHGGQTPDEWGICGARVTKYKAGVRRFPNLVPEFPDSSGAAIERAARDFWRSTWSGPSVMAIGMADPVLGPPVMRALHRDIRGCPPPLEFAEAGHFVQEWGDAVAPAALAVLKA